MAPRQLSAHLETWPLAKAFRIARGSKSEISVAVVHIAEADALGRGEGVPYGRYGESPQSVMETIRSAAEAIGSGMGRAELLREMPAGAARNAIDCALWDLESQLASEPVWTMAGLDAPAAVSTAFTLVLDTPTAIERAAQDESSRPLLKLKLAGDEHDLSRVEAARRGAPTAQLVVDANESWDVSQFNRCCPRFAELGVIAIEQPLAAGADAVLAELDHPVPICADESCHGLDTLDELSGRYEMVNLKLDKTGGLTAALAMSSAAKAAGFDIMVGCMCSTSLSLAPAMLLAQNAALVDLDAGLLLQADRAGAVRYHGSELQPCPALWGTGQRYRTDD